jgi:hypothetical protein
MYENLMDEVVTDENCRLALAAVKRNKGAAGIDRMTTKELESHLQAHGERIRAKLLAGTYVPSPARRVEIPRPGGGTRMLGFRRPVQTALEHKSHLGWAEIRHPFHPLRGQRFQVLKEHRTAGIDTLLLRELERGTFSIAREWTDWADPSPYYSLGLPPRRLDIHSLFELATLLEELTDHEQKS